MLSATLFLAIFAGITNSGEGQLISIFGAPSCLGKCNNEPAGIIHRFSRACSCAPSCEKRGICCEDYWVHCSNSCKRRCNKGYHPLYRCQCYDGCTDETCCADYKKICVDEAYERALPTTLPPPTTTRTTTTPEPKPIEIGYSFIQGKMITCPKEIPFVSCPTNPCNRACELFPGANCEVNQCGTCEAMYTDKDGLPVNCKDPAKYCSNGLRRFHCGDIDLCAGTSCPAFPRATCVPNICGGCYYDHVDDEGNVVDCDMENHFESQCEEGIQPLSCIPQPCDGLKCDADPTALCKNINCGKCRAEFYDIRGKVVNCSVTDASSKTLLCSNGKVPELCPSDLCHAQRCGSDFTPICKPDECNNCELKFYDDQGSEISCEGVSTEFETTGPTSAPMNMNLTASTVIIAHSQPSTTPEEPIENKTSSMPMDETETGDVDPTFGKCDNGNLPMNCNGNLCQNSDCPGNPLAFCKEDECDSCKPRFYDVGLQELTCQPSLDVSSPVKPQPPPAAESRLLRCLNGNIFRKCNHQLACVLAVCDANPQAICKANPCNECKPIFYNNVGMRIKCNKSESRSCAGKCGEIRNPTNFCSCDFGCKKRDDCCHDFASRCETCLGRCGKRILYASCQCTSNCRRKKNCCADFEDICLPAKSCKGKCGSPYVPNDICQCDEECTTKSNCCLDYENECA